MEPKDKILNPSLWELDDEHQQRDYERTAAERY